MSTKDIEYKSDTILVSVPKTKTNVPRLFAVTNPVWTNLIKKYAKLRPDHVNNQRFFLTYHNGRCTTQPIGINKMGQMPKAIAAFLKLSDSELYSGHCFRRSSASHLANRGGDLLTIKRHGGWKSSSVAEGYIDASIKKKIAVAQILSAEAGPSTSTQAGASTSAQAGPSNSVQARASTSTEAECSNSVPQLFLQADSNAGNTTIEGNEVSNIQHNLPGFTINAGANCNITIKVYNNCTTSKDD